MTKDRAASLLFLLTGLYGFLFSVGLPMGRWNEPGPGVFPLALSLLLLLSGAAWFIHGKPGIGKEAAEEKADRSAVAKSLATPLKIVVLTAALIAVFNRLGYLVSASLYLFALLFWVSRYRLIFSIGIAVAVGIGSWAFFVKILAVQLPAGLISF